MNDPSVFEIRCFDLLTVTVMLDQCEPDLTVVVWWRAGNAMRATVGDGTTYIVANPIYDPPVRYESCLKCLCDRFAMNSHDDGRVGVMEAVKAGVVQIQTLGPRTSDMWKCPLCQGHLSPYRVPRWKPET